MGEHDGYHYYVMQYIRGVGLDEVVARVSMIGDPHHFMMSVRLEILYRHPVPTETPLRVVGRILRLRGRLGCPRCYEVFRGSLVPLLERPGWVPVEHPALGARRPG